MEATKSLVVASAQPPKGLCPLCTRTMEQTFVVCRECKTPQHAPCWNSNSGRCFIAECGSNQYQVMQIGCGVIAGHPTLAQERLQKFGDGLGCAFTSGFGAWLLVTSWITLDFWPLRIGMIALSTLLAGGAIYNFLSSANMPAIECREQPLSIDSAGSDKTRLLTEGERAKLLALSEERERPYTRF